MMEATFYKLEYSHHIDFYMILPNNTYVHVLICFYENKSFFDIGLGKGEKSYNPKFKIGSIEFMEVYEKAKEQLKEFDEVLKSYPKKS